MERRRCNHHTLDEPLSTLDCFKSVIDPKSSLTNKNRYVVASQDEEVRRFCREVKGVPLVFVRRSVMIMEPMAETTVGVREGLERSKFRSGLKTRATGLLGKRKRRDEDTNSHTEREGVKTSFEGNEEGIKKKRSRGPKGPNPLAVKKPKKVPMATDGSFLDDEARARIADNGVNKIVTVTSGPIADVAQGTSQDVKTPPKRRKRRRKASEKGASVNPVSSVTLSNNTTE
ncbi:hypothetical protein ACLMJK_006716 [Lecanora helva]